MPGATLCPMTGAATAIVGPRTGLADVSIKTSHVVITPRRWWKALSLRRRISIPISDVATCTSDVQPDRSFTTETRRFGLGTATTRAGLFSGPQTRSWWLYRFGKNALVLTLAGNPLDYLVVQVDDADGDAAAIRSQLSH